MPTLDTPLDGMPTNINTRLWNHLQLLLPSPHHAILTNHTCPEEGTLAVLCGDLHHQAKGTINTIDLVEASVTVVYVTLPKCRSFTAAGNTTSPSYNFPNGLNIASSTSTSHERREQRGTLCGEAKT